MSKPHKVLIITSSGGGGLLQTANAKEQEIRAADPDAIIVKKDILKDWLGKFFGTFCAECWNLPQRSGNVIIQKIIVHIAHPISDYLLWPFYFAQALITLFKEDVDRVIDTQPLGTLAIVQALRIFNKTRKKNLLIEKVLVDLPTTKATHFFRSIKHLSDPSRAVIRIVTIAPLLEKGETSRDFWQKNCRLSEESIQYEDPYVRLSFRKYSKKPRSEEAISLKIRYQNQEELRFMRKIFERGEIQASISEKEILFEVLPKDRVITVLLGSQPSGKATFNYMKRFIELFKEDGAMTRTHLFMFRGNHKSGQESILKEMAHSLKEIADYPSYLSIIPFGFQNDDVIAPLFHRSDLTCTRSGGQTAMELLSVSSGEIWVHSETKGRRLSDKELLNGIPGWEAATAVYLQRVRNAKLVTPEIFPQLARELFHIDNSSGPSNRFLRSMGEDLVFAQRSLD